MLMVSPYELSVVSGGTTQQALVGGVGPVKLSLEYLVESGATGPTITVTTTSSGTSSTWTESPTASGYQVKPDFMNVAPGTTVTVGASGATARLRWCESFCC